MRALLTALTLTASLATASALGASAPAPNLAKALDSLDIALDNSAARQRTRQAYIDSVARLGDQTGTTELKLQAIDGYISFNTDSALSLLDRDLAGLSGPERLPFMWRKATILPLSGFIEDAKREYAEIPADSVPAALRPEYLEAGRQMYSYIASYYSDERSARYNDSVRSYQRRLLEVLDPDSPEYRFNQAEYYFMTGRQPMAKVLLEDLMRRLPANHRLRARTAHHLSSIARSEGDTNAYLCYLALSARSDVEQATREMLSLQELGSQLVDMDSERAYRYANVALQNAVECGARLRTFDTSQTLPVIEKAHNGNIARWRHRVYAIILGMTLLMIGLFAALLVLRYEIKKMRRLEASLRQANRAKEVYISQFLQLCSVYMHKLQQFSKTVTRKLAAGQADELYRLAKSGKFVDEQSSEFYQIFDDAFLHIYPNFPADVNKLLRPECRIELRKEEKLNTDLRILAFMRLGIDESARIAQVLNYSLNTIYAYRNRLKARAIHRDTFEADIQRLESLE